MYIMKRFFLSSLTLAALLFGAPSHAIVFFNSDCLCGEKAADDDTWGIDLTIYGGYVNGKSKELVYGTLGSESSSSSSSDWTISKLDWKINNLWVIGAVFKKTFFSDTIYFTVDGWTKVQADKSTLVDKDYTDPFHPNRYTDISKSPDTKLDKAQWISGELGFDFYKFMYRESAINLRLSVGYQYNRWHWKSYGGSYKYNQGEITGDFPNTLIIAYKQRLSIPYLALQMDWNWKEWDLSLFGKYSHKAYVNDHDFHALRNLVFTDKFKNGEFWALGVNGSVNLWNCGDALIDFTLKYSFEQLNTTKGSTTITGNNFSVSLDSESAGVEHYHQLIAFGFEAEF